jgi:uncharacterized protein
MSLSPSNGLLVPSIDVLINGSPVSAAVLRYVEDVVVDDSVELPSMFAFTVANADLEQQQALWADNTDLFSMGNVVEIKMSNAGNLASLIVGEITALEAEFVTSRLPALKVRGYDRGHRLQRGRKTRTFVQKKDSEIAAQIGGDAQLSVQATDTGASLEYVMQANQTDWEFLSERARRISYEVVVQDKTLLFRPVGNDQGAAITLGTENDLLEFYPRMSSAGQTTEVNMQGWSVKDKTALLGKSKTGDEVSTMGGQSSGAAIAQSAFGPAVEVVSDCPVADQAEADQLAKARFNDLVLDWITGEGLCRGRTDIRAGKVITIDGVGRRFGGQYYITSAIHRYSATYGYLTKFTVRRNAS